MVKRLFICSTLCNQIRTAMPRLTKEQRVWICLEMAGIENAQEVLRRWPAQWPGINAPSAVTVWKTYRKLQAEGTCNNLNKSRSGRLRTARSNQNIERVREALIEDGNRSSRRNGLGLSQSSFVRVAKILKFHPYVLVRRQKLEAGDPVLRREFCQRFVETNAQQPEFLNNLIISDEAIFSLNSEVNTKNVINYSLRGNGHPPDHYIEFKQGAGKLMVWMGVMKTGAVFGPHFVEGGLDSQEYLRIIRYHVIQREFREQNVNRAAVWWQQDGAPAHTSNASLHYLRGQFPGRVMSRRGDWPWPPRSPDLTVCDFFLWGYMKQAIWNVDLHEQPKNLEDLRAAILRVARSIPADMISRAFDGMVGRCEKCIEANGLWVTND